MRAKVGDVIRIIHPKGVTMECREFMASHGNNLVVTYVDNRPEAKLVNYQLESISRRVMVWTDDNSLIPLYDEEYAIDPLLTAVRARRHA